MRLIKYNQKGTIFDNRIEIRLKHDFIWLTIWNDFIMSFGTWSKLKCTLVVHEPLILDIFHSMNFISLGNPIVKSRIKFYSTYSWCKILLKYRWDTVLLQESQPFQVKSWWYTGKGIRIREATTTDLRYRINQRLSIRFHEENDSWCELETTRIS